MVTWRKSSYSGTDGGNCVEAANDAGVVLIRDTADHDGATIKVSGAAWERFTAAIRQGA